MSDANADDPFLHSFGMYLLFMSINLFGVKGDRQRRILRFYLIALPSFDLVEKNIFLKAINFQVANPAPTPQSGQAVRLFWRADNQR